MSKKTEGNGLIYTVTIGLEGVGIFNNFPDAFKKFWEMILKSLEEGTSWQVLETMNWITRKNENTQLPILIYDARDLAYDIGLLTPSDQPKTPPIINEAPTVDGWEEMVRERFVAVARDSAVCDFTWANQHLEEIMAEAKKGGADQETIDYIQSLLDESSEIATQSIAAIDQTLAQA